MIFVNAEFSYLDAGKNFRECRIFYDFKTETSANRLILIICSENRKKIGIYQENCKQTYWGAPAGAKRPQGAPGRRAERSGARSGPGGAAAQAPGDPARRDRRTPKGDGRAEGGGGHRAARSEAEDGPGDPAARRTRTGPPSGAPPPRRGASGGIDREKSGPLPE